MTTELTGTDKRIPPPCDPMVFKKGETVCTVRGKSWAIERWVQNVSMRADARLDWYYNGGIADILYLGDQAGRGRVLTAINDLVQDLEGTILSI